MNTTIVNITATTNPIPILNTNNDKYKKNISEYVDFIFPNAEQAMLFFINLQNNK